jgi:hypothetical protein
MPVQNKGQSAEKIASICRRLVYTPLSRVKWAGAQRKIQNKLRTLDVFE